MHRSPAEIRTAPEGIEVKENGSALTLLHTRGQQTSDYCEHAWDHCALDLWMRTRVRSRSIMSIRTSFVFVLLATAAWGQTQKLDPRSTMHITFPEDSPVTVVSADWGESNASARGGAMLLDLHTSLSLRNSGSRRIRGITLLVSAQDVTPGGKASVSVPSLNAAPGDNFPIRIDLRLLRPLQAGNGPLVEIGLDGILFDDLSFFGPNRLNSRRSMTVWEMEARRDRQYFRQVLESHGREALKAEMLASLDHQADRSVMDARVAQSGRATTTQK